MELLSKDIALIVYKYIHQFDYDVLRNQYKTLWLNDRTLIDQDANDDGWVLDRIYWDEEQQCFSTRYAYVANYRELGSKSWFDNIYYFTMYYKSEEQYLLVDSAETGAKLPKHYLTHKVRLS